MCRKIGVMACRFGTRKSSTLITGTHRVGSSPGLQTFVDLTYGAGALIEWELFSHVDSVGHPALRGEPTGWDGINVTGTLLFSGETQLAIALGGSVDLLDAYWQSDRSWLVFDVGAGGSLTGYEEYLSLAAANPEGFSLRQEGSDVWLDYDASFYSVPEPSGALVLLVGLLSLGVRRRRQEEEETGRF